jgi:hypothetical protein
MPERQPQTVARNKDVLPDKRRLDSGSARRLRRSAGAQNKKDQDGSVSTTRRCE